MSDSQPLQFRDNLEGQEAHLESSGRSSNRAVLARRDVSLISTDENRGGGI